MLRNISVLSVVLAVGLASLQTPASAIPVRVNYTITGGSFDGMVASGPVTSGAASVLLPFATITASPYSATTAAAVLTRLTLAGPSGGFELLLTATGRTGGARFYPNGDVWAFVAQIPNDARSTDGLGGGTTHMSIVPLWYLTGSPSNVSGWIDTFYTLDNFFRHSWQGVEINRVFIPEPHTAALVTAGLAVLGGLAGAKRGRSKTRQV